MRAAFVLGVVATLRGVNLLFACQPLNTFEK
jgi:hypothetical protein